MDPTGFFGGCSTDSISSTAQCVGNFLNPSMPNPIGIFEPITGGRLNQKIAAINIFEWDMWAGILSVDFSQRLQELFTKIVNVPLVLVSSILEIVAASLTFLVMFAVKFMFTYLFYVSLGFQTILMYFDNNSNGLESEDKLKSTLVLMAGATILTLTIGVGWIK